MSREVAGPGEVIRYDAPLFFLGDSHARMFSNVLFETDTGKPYFSIAKHVHQLRFESTVRIDRTLNRAIMGALQTESLVITEDGAAVATHRLPPEQRAAYPHAEHDPVLVIMCGELDVRTLTTESGEGADWEVPFDVPHLDGFAPALGGSIPYETLNAILNERLRRFFAMLTFFKSLGFQHLYVHSIAPEFAPPERAQDASWKPSRLRYKLTLMLHRLMRAFCASSSIGFIDIWDDITEGGVARPEFYLDGFHVNMRAAQVTMDRLLEAEGVPATCIAARRCRPIYCIGDEIVGAFRNVVVRSHETLYAPRVHYIEGYSFVTNRGPLSLAHQRFLTALHSDAALIFDEETRTIRAEHFKEHRNARYEPPVLACCGSLDAARLRAQPSADLDETLRLFLESLESVRNVGFSRLSVLGVPAGGGDEPFVAQLNDALRSDAARHGLRFIDFPKRDETSVLCALSALIAEVEDHVPVAAPDGGFPYEGRPRWTRWHDAVEGVPSGDLDPQGAAKFRFDRATAIASAGSCFARRIAANLRQRGFRYLATEEGDDYSARFGNVYTTLQLLQLLRRAYGSFAPGDAVWKKGERFVDALRPRMRDYADVDELERDRAGHLAAVRRMFEELDVFVFTLGQTETWCSNVDGTAYPVCPGRDVGVFSPARYHFRNIGVVDNIAYLQAFITELRAVNARARLILSVSPVPLVATMEDRHVLRASVYSKAALRAAAEEVANAHANVDYFASYEIITASFNADRYFAPDRRHVTDEGVAHVMRSFLKQYAGEVVNDDVPSGTALDPCDEDVLAELLERDFR